MIVLSASLKRPASNGAFGARLAPGPPLPAGWTLAAGVPPPAALALPTWPKTPLEPTATPITNTRTRTTSAAIERAGRGVGGEAHGAEGVWSKLIARRSSQHQQ